MTAAQTLAEFAVDLSYERIPGEVVERAKDCVIDTVGACVFGAELPWSKIVIEYARRNSAQGECSVLGTPTKVRAPFACLANGAVQRAVLHGPRALPRSHRPARVFRGELE